MWWQEREGEVGAAVVSGLDPMQEGQERFWCRPPPPPAWESEVGLLRSTPARLTSNPAAGAWGWEFGLPTPWVLSLSGTQASGPL